MNLKRNNNNNRNEITEPKEEIKRNNRNNSNENFFCSNAIKYGSFDKYFLYSEEMLYKNNNNSNKLIYNKNYNLII